MLDIFKYVLKVIKTIFILKLLMVFHKSIIYERLNLTLSTLIRNRMRSFKHQRKVNGKNQSNE